VATPRFSVKIPAFATVISGYTKLRVMAPRNAPLDGAEITIVGAGFGGLSAACYLADAGADVTVLERHEDPGGLAGRIERDGFRIDTGPSWYLMPDAFERFFAQFDREPEEYYELTQLDPGYTIQWKDGDEARVPADRAGQKALFEEYEPGAGERLDEYLDDAEETYELGMERFVYPSRSRLRDMLDTDVVRSVRALPKLRPMDDHVRNYFEHPKLRQIAEYKLVFLGGSPYNTPALYTLMSHVDMNLGVYHPTGGIASVIDGLVDLAEELGAEIETNAEVTRIEPDTTEDGGFSLLAGGEPRHADRVVANAPPSHVEQELLPGAYNSRESYWDARTYAPSAYLLYLGVEGSVEELDHHTLVLPTDWDPHFEKIFDDPAWPDDPAYYVHAPTETDPELAPDGHEIVFVLVPLAPGLEDTPEIRDRFRGQVLDDLAEHTGAELRDRIVLEEDACIEDFKRRFDAPGGTALALAHTLDQTGPLRPAHRAPGVDGLYYVGGYTSPGIGMPMCLLSGEHVTEAITEDATGEEGTVPPVVPTSTWRSRL
jgi:phytoene desaturase